MSTTTIKIKMSDIGMDKLNYIAAATPNDSLEKVAAILLMRALDDQYNVTDLWLAYGQYIDSLAKEAESEAANDDESGAESDTPNLH